MHVCKQCEDAILSAASTRLKVHADAEQLGVATGTLERHVVDTLAGNGRGRERSVGLTMSAWDTTHYTPYCAASDPDAHPGTTDPTASRPLNAQTLTAHF